MARWSEVEAQTPELAARVRSSFEAHTHKTLATLRRDGSPRISGTEAQFVDGDLWMGSMWRAVKALDLQRDPRFALHSGTEEPEAGLRDAKLAGRVEEITDPELIARINKNAPPGDSHLFRCDITELVLIGLGGDPPDHIVIDSWHEGRGTTRRTRR